MSSGENLNGGLRKSLTHTLRAKARNTNMYTQNLELQKQTF